MAAGVALKVGVDADEGELAHFDTGLLAYFAPAGSLHSLADLDKAAGRARRVRGRVQTRQTGWLGRQETKAVRLKAKLCKQF